MIQIILGGLGLVCFAVACGMDPQSDGTRAGPVVFGLLLITGAVFL
jgi:hypothetical protein